MPLDNTNKIGEIMPDSVAMKAGLKENDHILKINTKEIKSWDDFYKEISTHPNKAVKMEVQTGKENPRTIKVTPEAKQTSDGKKVGVVGVTKPLDKSISGKIAGGFQLAYSSSTALIDAIKGLFTGFSLNKLGGPVMIYKISSDAASNGILNVIWLMAMLSLNLGVVNLFPIPALDSGKIILNIIEGVRGKPLSQEKEGMITLIGFAFLMVLMVLITWNDIQRFFFR